MPSVVYADQASACRDMAEQALLGHPAFIKKERSAPQLSDSLTSTLAQHQIEQPAVTVANRQFNLAGTALATQTPTTVSAGACTHNLRFRLSLRAMLAEKWRWKGDGRGTQDLHRQFPQAHEIAIQANLDGDVQEVQISKLERSGQFQSS